MRRNRVTLIAEALVWHQLLAGGTCTCGHVYSIGSSIQKHRAEAIDAALSSLYDGQADAEEITKHDLIERFYDWKEQQS